MTETLSQEHAETLGKIQAENDAGNDAGVPAHSAALRPRPAINLDNAFFFESLDQRGELTIQNCDDCGELRHPPVPMCPECNSVHWSPQVMAGRGTVHSYVVLYHPIVPPFEPGYVVAVIELEEGPRVVMNLEGADHDDIRIGMPVTVNAERMDENLVLPVARPAGGKP